jgi:hypothetical protein
MTVRAQNITMRSKKTTVRSKKRLYSIKLNERKG